MNHRLVLVSVLAILAFSQFGVAEQKRDLTSLTDKEVDEILKEWDENDPDFDPEDLDDSDIYSQKMKNKQQPGNIDMSQFIGKSKEELDFMINKKNQMLIIMVSLYGFDHDQEALRVGEIWSQALKNAQFDTVQYYPVDKTQCMFTIMDGSTAMNVIQYLTQQEHITVVEIDGKKYPGVHASKAEANKDSKKDSNNDEL